MSLRLKRAQKILRERGSMKMKYYAQLQLLAKEVSKTNAERAGKIKKFAEEFLDYVLGVIPYSAEKAKEIQAKADEYQQELDEKVEGKDLTYSLTF